MCFGRKWEEILPFGAQGWNLDLVSAVIEVKMDPFEWHGTKSGEFGFTAKISVLSEMIDLSENEWILVNMSKKRKILVKISILQKIT